MNILNKLQANGFKVVGRYISKKSSKTNRYEVKGYLNDDSIYFFSDNVYPFKSGYNSFSEYSETDSLKVQNYVKKVKQKEAKNPFNVPFETYSELTSSVSVFNDFLINTCRENLNQNLKNYFDVRGVSIGYMEGATAFPFIDYEGNFVTAQLIKYDSKGKRLKSDFSTNWFHSYKPIKKELEGVSEEEKYSINIKCFFGEQFLKGSNNTVAIVEAPKTAVILKEIYPNIDFLATAGEQQLFNKELEVLEGKNVILFPDAHTTKWKDFADKKGFYCSDILNKEDVPEGSDLADFVFDYESSVFSEIHSLLFSLNEGDFDFEYNSDKIEFEFSLKNDSKEYYTAVPLYYEGKEVLHSVDYSSNSRVIFEGEYFNLYSEDFKILNAQIDWHRPHNNKNVFEVLNEKQFILNLQKCFTILKYYNPSNYKGIFLETLKNLKGSNYSFNKNYVKYRLIPLWEKLQRSVNDFVKYRNWKYTSSKRLIRTDFVKELNNSRFLLKLTLSLRNVKKVIKENRFITLDDVGINKDYKRSGYSEVIKKVKDYNQFFIGCKTAKGYETKLKLEGCTKSSPPHIIPLYSGEKNVQISKIARNSGVKNRKTIKDFLLFKRDYNVKDELIQFINDVLKAIESNSITVNRFNGRISDFIIAKVKTDKEILQDACIGWNEAFKPIKELKEELTNETNKDVLKAIKSEIEHLEFLKLSKERKLNFNDHYERSTFIEKYYSEQIEDISSDLKLKKVA